MSRDDEDGYVLVKPLFGVLPKFENSEPSMKLFFPDLVRAIDAGTEAKRLATVKFAPAQALSGDEMAMLRLYRQCTPEDRQVLLRTARGLARTNRS